MKVDNTEVNKHSYSNTVNLHVALYKWYFICDFAPINAESSFLMLNIYINSLFHITFCKQWTHFGNTF